MSTDGPRTQSPKCGSGFFEKREGAPSSRAREFRETSPESFPARYSLQTVSILELDILSLIYIRLFVTRTVIRNRRTDRERYNMYSDTEKYNI